MPAKSRIHNLAQEARFVFRGTVKKLKAATMSSVPVTGSTVIVKVDEIIQAPRALSNYTGKEITVQLSGRQKVKVGQAAVFFTNGWLFGDSVAVQSIGHHPVEKTALALRMTDAGPGDPVKNLAKRDMKARLDNADVVVSGRVKSISLPEEPAGGPALTAIADRTTRRAPVSEHDPMWREAEVEVDDVHKGKHSKKTIVIRFPASRDVMWRKAPKFHPGQEGYFMLQKASPKDLKRGSAKAAVGRLMAAKEKESTEVYTALHPDDFHPKDKADEIKTVLDEASSEDNG